MVQGIKTSFIQNDPPLEFLCVFLHKVANQQTDILRTLPQGRNSQGKYIDAVIEIGAQQTLFHHIFQIGVGCHNNANINRNNLRPANATDPTILQDAQ